VEYRNIDFKQLHGDDASYILQKSDEFLSRISGVYEARQRSAVVGQYSGLFDYHSLAGGTAGPAGYTLAFAMHFLVVTERQLATSQQ